MTHFKLVAISSNTNSFGLNQYIFLAPSGEAWCGCKYKPCCNLKEGDFVTLPKDRAAGLSSLGFEVPMEMPNPPRNVIEEAFP